MNRNLKPPKNNLKEKFYIFLILLGMTSVIYFIATSLRNDELKDIEFIKIDYKITRGIITEKHSYKGNSIHVRYKVDGKLFNEIDGYNEKYKFKEGDSLTLKYSTTKPELMITQYNDEY